MLLQVREDPVGDVVRFLNGYNLGYYAEYIVLATVGAGFYYNLCFKQYKLAELCAHELSKILPVSVLDNPPVSSSTSIYHCTGSRERFISRTKTVCWISENKFEIHNKPRNLVGSVKYSKSTPYGCNVCKISM